MSSKAGYHGVILSVDLSTGKAQKVAIPSEDLDNFVGGQGLGIKILWDRLKKPGVDPLSPENPHAATAHPQVLHAGGAEDQCDQG